MDLADGLFRIPPDAALAEAWQGLVDLAAGRGTQPADLPEDALPALGALASLYLPVAHPPRRPFVVGQLGQSLDGFIATRTGSSHYVTGPASLVHLHRLRALCDAVVVGWRTAATDDPQLTVRHVPGADPLRVVIDLEGRLPGDLRLFAPTGPGALRLTAGGVPPLPGVESVEISTAGGRFDPASIVRVLAQRGCARILVEGGGETVSSFLAASSLDRMHLAVAPLAIGAGRAGLRVPPVDELRDALRPASRHYPMGDDVLFDLDLRAPR